MAIRDDESPPEAAADRAQNSARTWLRSRTAWIVLSCIIAAVLLVMWLRYNLDSLNANERRLIGTWTWKDAPGQTITQFRADRTQRHIVSPTDQRPRFRRWWIEGETMVEEYNTRFRLVKLFNEHVRRVKPNTGRAEIVFNADGTLTYTLYDGRQKIAIPWQSEFLTEAP